LKIAFQADADLDPDIWRGLCRRERNIDFQGHVGVIPRGASDPEVLKLSAAANRVLVSADIQTMLVHFAEFIAHEESPGLILIPSSRSIGPVIEGLLLVWSHWMPDQFRNRGVWLPNA
jgi:hypothetical protein